MSRPTRIHRQVAMTFTCECGLETSNDCSKCDTCCSCRKPKEPNDEEYEEYDELFFFEEFEEEEECLHVPCVHVPGLDMHRVHVPGPLHMHRQFAINFKCRKCGLETANDCYACNTCCSCDVTRHPGEIASYASHRHRHEEPKEDDLETKEPEPDESHYEYDEEDACNSEKDSDWYDSDSEYDRLDYSR